MNNSLGMRHSAMRSDARKFLKPADVPHGMKWGEVEPQFFALVDKKLKFVTTKHNQVVVFSSREAANEACKQRGWPGNIGMGQEKWEKFQRSFSYILDPSYSVVPRPVPLIPLPLLLLVISASSLLLFWFFRESQLLQLISSWFPG
eukprot:TRINITY_DN4092_c0_g1_i1.p1 TRINITY_DN4092_c0_g1~~TRINITY_DN4092_c0_g1_i1.p1  ORF type:complete len:146 (+),score=15.90 TRINITY_DN4092_c0_g1_i1:445-882(+)